MKLFGKKDGDAPEDNNDLGEEQFDAPDAVDEVMADMEPLPGEEPAPKALSAPSRSLSAAAGGGRKGLLVLALLVVLAGMGGGYFYFMEGGEDYKKPMHVKAKSPAVPAAETAKAPPQPPAPAAEPEAGPATAQADPFAAPPESSPAAAPNADPFAPAAPPAAASADPFAPAAPEAAGLGQPPGDEASAIAPTPVGDGAAPVAAAPDELAPDLPPPDLGAAPSSPGTGQPASSPAADPFAPAPAPTATGAADPFAPAPAQPPAATAGGEDLPLPADTMLEPTTPGGKPAATADAKPPESAPSWAAPGTAAVPGTSNPALKPTSASDAELAIVQNDVILDQLAPPAAAQKPANGAAAPSTAPTGMPFDPNAPKPGPNDVLKQLQQNLETPAIRRKISSGYMIIRKESDADDIDSRLTAARTALAQGRAAAALELFEDLKRDFPKDKRILMGRAVSLQKLGQEEDALAAYEAVLNNDPKNLDALSNMLGLLKSKDPGLAVEKLQELRDTYPYQGDITAQLGIAYASNGQFDQGLKYLEMADSLKPGSAYVLYNKAVLLDKMGRRQDAASLYRRILRLAADGELDQKLPLETIRSRLAVLR